jgi:hypothetical protein
VLWSLFAVSLTNDLTMTVVEKIVYMTMRKAKALKQVDRKDVMNVNGSGVVGFDKSW